MQAMMSLVSLYSKLPGRSDLRAPHSLPSQSGAPWCGQRLRMAWYSPATLNTPIERPATRTILRLPGGISSALPTTNLIVSPYISSEVVELAAVLEVDLRLHLVGEDVRQREVWIVGVP